MPQARSHHAGSRFRRRPFPLDRIRFPPVPDLERRPGPEPGPHVRLWRRRGRHVQQPGRPARGGEPPGRREPRRRRAAAVQRRPTERQQRRPRRAAGGHPDRAQPGRHHLPLLPQPRTPDEWGTRLSGERGQADHHRDPAPGGGPGPHPRPGAPGLARLVVHPPARAAGPGAGAPGQHHRATRRCPAATAGRAARRVCDAADRWRPVDRVLLTDTPDLRPTPPGQPPPGRTQQAGHDARPACAATRCTATSATASASRRTASRWSTTRSASATWSSPPRARAISRTSRAPLTPSWKVRASA